MKDRIQLSQALVNEINSVCSTEYAIKDFESLKDCVTDLIPGHEVCAGCPVRKGCATIMAEKRIGMVNVRNHDFDAVEAAIKEVIEGRAIPIAFAPEVAVPRPPVALPPPPPPPLPKPVIPPAPASMSLPPPPPVPMAAMSMPLPPPPPMAPPPMPLPVPAIPSAATAQRPVGLKLDPKKAPEGFPDAYDRDSLVDLAEQLGFSRKDDIGRRRAPSIVELILSKMPAWRSAGYDIGTVSETIQPVPSNGANGQHADAVASQDELSSEDAVQDASMEVPKFEAKSVEAAKDGKPDLFGVTYSQAEVIFMPDKWDQAIAFIQKMRKSIADIKIRVNG